ncbi:hypothetical protein GWR56_13930 [Mucilaginibacter sp. 14171R-50]|uniref:hypothetical protein n=1 Tax=Mucilaginibacter sp. 14171R-50 TaxID=2703789 RepID=UPI00138C9AEB|nr:hypothetical protein GWR56_13930 [Mucilaginibacter sp. 14171R-50]
MEQYDALDEAEKAAFILQGEFLADREESGLIVQLYSVGSFYGELYYDPLTENNSDSADWIPLLSKIRRYIRRRSTRPWESGSFMWMTRTEILCVLESQFI